MAVYEIELNNSYANQEFDVLLDDIQNTIHVLLQTVNDITMMSIFVNNEQMGQPFMCFANQPIVPYPYMIDILGGNFVFQTQDNNYPNFENFGTTCFLYFITKDELNNAE